MTDHRFLPALRLSLAIATLSLVASTWPLWTGSSSFPQIPFLQCLCEVGAWADAGALGLILGGALATLFGSTVSLIDAGRNREAKLPRIALRLETFGPWLIAIGLGSSALLNQHRLQPWAWHFILLAPVLARRIYLWNVDFRDSPGNGVPNLNRPETLDYYFPLAITACVYFGSAASKVDEEFALTYGQQLINALLSAIGLSARLWSEQTRQVLASGLPLCEFLVMGLVLHPRTRRVGLATSIVMHVLLLLALGPSGMNHRPGVIIWNFFFIIQNLILWRYSKANWIRSFQEEIEAGPRVADIQEPARAEAELKRLFWLKGPIWVFSQFLSGPLTCVACFTPVLFQFRLCDPWPAWAVYASQPARVTVLLDHAAAENLPADLRQFIQPRQLDDGRVFFRADLWSIEATGAPIYPGDRFPIAVASSFAGRPKLSNKVDVVVESQSAWWTGERTAREYQGTEDISRLAGGFWINTRPRH